MRGGQAKTAPFLEETKQNRYQNEPSEAVATAGCLQSEAVRSRNTMIT